MVDVDGRQPHIGRWIAQHLPDFAWKPCDDTFYSSWSTPPYDQL